MDKPLAASSFNKALAFGLAVTLVVWTFGVYFVPRVEAVTAHTDGILVLSGGTIFKIEGGQRSGFPSANVFFSHGYSFGMAVPANSADLALTQGPNVQFADGSLVNDGGTVYLIYGGQKHGFTSAAVFTGLGYKFANVYNESLAGYTQGADVTSTTQAHVAGTLINSNGTIYKVTATGRAGIPTLAVFQSWGFDFAKTVPANSADLALATEANLSYRVGAVVNDGGTVWAITSASEKRGFPTASCFLDSGFQWSQLLVGTSSGFTAGALMCEGTTTPTTTSTGTLTVSLASDTPAAGIAIKNAARVPFTKINLTATGGDVIVDSWVMQRGGVAQDTDFSSVDIIDLSSNSSINDTGKTFNTEHRATFSEDFTIKNGETKSVTLAGNIASGAGSGDQPTLGLVSITLKGGTVSGSFPIYGNAMTINTNITIGTATVSRGAYSNASTTLEVGKTAYTFFSFQVQAGSAEDITFSQVKIYEEGSASLTTDVKNLKLYRDGTFLADGTISGSYVNFNFTAQSLPKGQTGQYQVKGDVVSGSARTIKLEIYRNTDLLVTGTTYNANITPTFSGTGSGSGNPYLTDNQFTISVGTLRVGRSNTVGAGNIAVGNNQTIGAFEFEAKGEAVVISKLTLTITSSTASQIEDALQSVRLVDANGATVAGPTDVTSGATVTVVFSDTFTVPVGVNVYKVVGNLVTNGGWATNDTIYAGINTPASAITAKGDVTGQTITPSPASNITTSTQTVKAATLTITRNSTPTNKSVITNSIGVLAGSWTFDATDSGENIRVTSIGIGASSTHMNNLTLKADGVAQSPVNDAPTAGNRALGTLATSTFALSSPIIVTAGDTVVVDLYVDVGSNAAAGEVSQFGITYSSSIIAYGVTTGNTASISLVPDHGANLTVAAAGTLAINIDSAAEATRMQVYGTTGVSLSKIRMKATNEAVNIRKITVRVADGALTSTADATYPYQMVQKLYLKLDGTIFGQTAGYSLGQASTAINFNVGDFQIPEGTTGKQLALVGDLVAIGTNQPGVANADIKVGVNGKNGFTADGAGSNASATISYSDSTGSPIILHKSMPSVVIETPTNKLTVTSALARVKVSAVGNSVGLYKMSFDTTTSTGVTLATAYLKLVSCGVCGGVADSSQLTATSDGTNLGASGHMYWPLTVDVNQTHAKYYLNIAAGGTAVIDLMATVGGFGSTTTESVSTTVLGDGASSTMATTGVDATKFNGVAVSMTNGNFVWSDLNTDDSNTTTARGQTQWYNGYYVTGLGATPSTTPVTVGE